MTTYFSIAVIFFFLIIFFAIYDKHANPEEYSYMGLEDILSGIIIMIFGAIIWPVMAITLLYLVIREIIAKRLTD